jgi:D-serine deaminase-like pyridoxal phosphate-dependent protein
MISRPTLLIDEQKAKDNIRAILNKCKQHNLSFRPHFKTHQSTTVGEWYKEMGVTKITVSSVIMAEYFINHGWRDVVIAFPYNPLEAALIETLAGQASITLLIESKEALDHLTKKVNQCVNYQIAVDCGYHRTGIHWENVELIKDLMNYPSHHRFAGLLTHAGHTYNARGKTQVMDTHQSALSNIRSLVRHLGEEVTISYGDTPSASICDQWGGINELRCGNMVYYDLTQAAIGSCELENIAVAIACPVVSKHPERNELIVYGGGVHFSKDRLETDAGTIYGQGVRLEGAQWHILHDVVLIGLSQEHGKVSAPPTFIEKVQIGDLIGFLPVHSCMAADLLVLQQTLSGLPIKKNMMK